MISIELISLDAVAARWT